MYDREIAIAELRTNALTLAMKFFVDSFENRGRATESDYKESFDEACKALADELRKPEKCYACGQDRS